MSKIFVLLACLVTISVQIANASHNEELVYETFSSCLASEESIAKYKESGTYDVCTQTIKPCDPNEHRRLDGSCNNLNYPVAGTYNEPMSRVLPACFGKDNTVRTAEGGGPLTPERKCRTEILGEGRASHVSLTLLLGYMVIIFFGDMSTVHDTLNYLKTTRNCCTKAGKANPICAPLYIPENDPVHRFSGVRCLNQTKPLTHQYYGCAAQDTVPTRIGNNTRGIDLAVLYQASRTAMDTARTFVGGELKVEVINGREFPINGTSKDKCIANNLPEENYCFGCNGNGILGPNLMVILFYRMHNYVARSFAVINPCWSDDQIFYKTKQIIIAMYLQIVFYEAFTEILGREHMIKHGIISPYLGFRKLYNPHKKPELSLEFVYSGRYFHTLQEGRVHMYDEDYKYVKDIPMGNLTLRTGFLAVDDNIEMITRGAFIQRFGGADYITDPDLSEVAMGNLQLASDLFTNDLSKGRLSGLAPYVEYKRLFNPDKEYECFEDLLDDIPVDRLDRLKQVYKSVGDIDLLAGMWAERHLSTQGASRMVSNFMTRQLHHSVRTDRHWYELEDAPHAFTLAQLLEIRKATAAYILCTVGDGVTRIQPHALRVAGPRNKVRSCDSIRKVNLWAWKDLNCDSK